MDTVPLPDAPQAVRSALKLIARRTAQVVHIGSQVGQPTGGIAPVQEDFNELYSCGYFHSQQMSELSRREAALALLVCSRTEPSHACLFCRLS